MCSDGNDILDSLTSEDFHKALSMKGTEDAVSEKLLTVMSTGGFGDVMSLLDEHVDGADRDGFSPGDVGRALERELRSLLCSKDAKYQALRTELKKAKGSARQIGIGVATAIAADWHLSVGLVTPFVMVFLMGALQIGTQAWCAGRSIAAVKAKKKH